MRTSSLWERTLTFFPQFLAAAYEHVQPGSRVAVVGASDGKFVLPLAAAGYRVLAIERDSLALHGGDVRLPGDVTTSVPGLIARLKAEHIQDQVQVVEQDFLAARPPCGPCDAVWTSCSWHYSVSSRLPGPPDQQIGESLISQLTPLAAEAADRKVSLVPLSCMDVEDCSRTPDRIRYLTSVAITGSEAFRRESIGWQPCRLPVTDVFREETTVSRPVRDACLVAA
jgi:hypothetical protein